jgi:hypothetical protein
VDGGDVPAGRTGLPAQQYAGFLSGQLDNAARRFFLRD